MGAFMHYVLKPLSLIGALNWGLVGFFKFDLVAWLFGPSFMSNPFSYMVHIIYVLRISSTCFVF